MWVEIRAERRDEHSGTRRRNTGGGKEELHEIGLICFSDSAVVCVCVCVVFQPSKQSRVDWPCTFGPGYVGRAELVWGNHRLVLLT